MTSDTKPSWLAKTLPIGTPGYHIFLSAIAVLVLGPLGGVTAAYMNFANERAVARLGELAKNQEASGR